MTPDPWGTEPCVLDLREVDETHVALVGGKGAHLGALARTDGVRVPDGFCVTTHAFRRVVAEAPPVVDLLGRLERVDPEDREAVRMLSARLRRAVEETALPDDVAAAVARAHARLCAQSPSTEAPHAQAPPAEAPRTEAPAAEAPPAEVPCAVRSSATAEDLPTASFAGQQDSYLDVVGPAEVLRHVVRCWASLFTERAVTYRGRNGIDHRAVRMAVVVQRMVRPRAAGVLFTADPVTGHRRTATVEAGAGLGDALVSGRENPDLFTVRDGEVVAGAGTPPQERRTLTDGEVLRLERLGRRIEERFGCPQDIEWCLADDGFHIVQSRPVTTLFPVPVREDGDRGNHVYVSVGHQQMMTDAMKPLGLSMWRLTALVPMHEAGGRLFVDVTQRLASPASRAGLLYHMEKGDPLVRDALETVLAREDFLPAAPDAEAPAPLFGGASASDGADPSVVAELVERSRESVAALEREVRTKSGPELFDFLLEAFEEQKRALGDPLNVQAIAAGMEATWWLNDRLHEWLGEKNAADTLTLSAPGNVTSEMGLALLDVADVIRPHPEVVAYLQDVRDGGDCGNGDGDGDGGFLDGLSALPGGAEARKAVESYLDRYGMRCAGEIDITRPRWRERPAVLVPLILDNVRNFGPGAAARHFEQGRRKAQQKEQDVLARLRALPDGDRKAEETQRMIDRVRAFIGYREYPKYGIVSRYFVYRRALLGEAERLVRAGVLAEKEDVFHLTFQEFREVVRTHRVDGDLVRRRKEAFRSYCALTPPRVLTSDGEALTGAYRRDGVPEGALTGVPVSTGTVEGRARVVLDMAEADLAAGDILVTAFTDPGWSPLFTAVAGLVTEVGGQMTHGAVIAREYGLPAVVGVEGATRLIRDGQRIRVHGADGYVELLP